MAHVIRRAPVAAPVVEACVPEVVEVQETARVDARHLQDLIKIDTPVDTRANPRLAHTVRRTPMGEPPPPKFTAKGSAIEIPVAPAAETDSAAATAVMPAETVEELVATESAGETAVMPVANAQPIVVAPHRAPMRSSVTFIAAATAAVLAGTACVLALVL